MKKRNVIILLVFAAILLPAIFANAQKRVTPVDTSKELKIISKEELKAMRKRAKVEQAYADSIARDSLKLDSIDNAKKVHRPLFMSASFGANIFDPLMKVLGRDYGGGELWASINLKNRFIPIVELGFGTANSTPDDGNFTYKGKTSFYGKIGMNYNFMYSKDPKYQMYLGVRAGWSAFKYDINDISITNGYWQQAQNFDITGQSSNATWGEIVLGLQVALYKNFAMGWNVRYNFLFNVKDNPNSRPWYIPGFGTRNTKLNVGLSLIYTLPLHKEKLRNTKDSNAVTVDTNIPENSRTAEDNNNN